MRDMSEVLDLTLKLPIRGRTYVVQPPPAAVAAQLMNRLAIGVAVDAGIPLAPEDAAAATVTDDEMPDFGRACLGDTLDELNDAGLSQAEIDFAVETAFLAWTVGKAFAETFWETGGKATAPTLAGRPTEILIRMAGESTTPTPASASGTSDPKSTKDQARP